MTADTISWLLMNLYLLIVWFCFLWLLKIWADYWVEKEMNKYTKKTQDQKFEEMLK